MTIQNKLSNLPSVDECAKSPQGRKLLETYPRRIVIRSIREVIDSRRGDILEGLTPDLAMEAVAADIERVLKRHWRYKLRPLINASGVVIHTNLGRSILSEKAVENMVKTARSYTNLEYEITLGKRGRRYSHIEDIIKELTGAEDAVIVNNNAAAVLICLDTFARGKEVVVSRGELVEIGGSFRIPEVMKASGAVLREVGATNKTHLHDYEDAINEDTSLFMKIHQSNYKIIGFTEEVSISALSALGREVNIPVVADLGSGCMIDMERFGIFGEPTVQEVIGHGADLVTFSGDKLLGGPQAGIIVGKQKYIKKIQKNPMMRAMRVDKMTLASLEATFMHYLSEEEALSSIPTLRMLIQSVEDIKKRARRIHTALKNVVSEHADINIIKDQSRAGGGSLPETDFPTFAVSIKPLKISVNALEKKLRMGSIAVIGRIQDDVFLLDARTVQEREVKTLTECVMKAFK